MIALPFRFNSSEPFDFLPCSVVLFLFIPVLFVRDRDVAILIFTNFFFIFFPFIIFLFTFSLFIPLLLSLYIFSRLLLYYVTYHPLALHTVAVHPLPQLTWPAISPTHIVLISHAFSVSWLNIYHHTFIMADC